MPGQRQRRRDPRRQRSQSGRGLDCAWPRRRARPYRRAGASEASCTYGRESVTVEAARSSTLLASC
eukprot:3780096-Prymnesium_polylepis.1